MKVPQLFSLEGKVAVISGPTKGIGRAMANALAEAGADIALIQRSEETKVRDEILSLGRRCKIFSCDLENNEQVKTVIPAIVQHFNRIDILVNNGGVQRRTLALEFSEEDWDAVMQVNLKAVWLLCQQAGKYMVQQNFGKIINIGSILSFQGGINVPAYAASKGGVAQLTKALSNEWAKYNVNVNAIAPGYIVTEMSEAVFKDEMRYKQVTERIPAGRWGQPDDFKGSVVYLASDASNYMHGHILTVDGGWLGR